MCLYFYKMNKCIYLESNIFENHTLNRNEASASLYHKLSQDKSEARFKRSAPLGTTQAKWWHMAPVNRVLSFAREEAKWSHMA